MSSLRFAVAVTAAATMALSASAAGKVTVRTARNHRGWTDAVVLNNGHVEAVVVPSVGRLMQFRFATAVDGPIWENPQLMGKPMPEKPWDASHGSFGGDKTWPAPQSQWNWPPPDVFDAVPLAFRVEADQTVVLTSPVSARFGIRTERRLTLSPDAPKLQIVTTYEKVSGPPMETGVWVITQAKDPVGVYLPVPKDTKFPEGSSKELGGLPKDQSELKDGFVRLARDLKASHKIGNDASSIVWVGVHEVLRIDIAREADGKYPDGGCSTEIYTNGDPVPYVELETLGPLHTLNVGDRISATNTYTLYHREGANPLEQVKQILAH